MRFALALLALLAAGPAAARAEQLVSTLSDADVEINSTFAGSRIVVFGAILHPVEGAEYETAVVVQGPAQTIVARRKERVLGVWLNTTSEEFDRVPSYYVAHLSENLDEAASREQRAQYRLGFESLGFVRSAYDEEDAAFAQAVIDIQRERGLFVERPDAVEFLAPNVFRTTFFLPAIIPTGTYKVSVYIFRNEVLLAAQVQNLHIDKIGYNAQIADFARSSPLTYGLLTLALALATGWIGGIVFRRG